jgi:hypothetical protein
MVKKLKEAHTNGNISVSNVGSSKSECITLTYTLKENLQSLDNITKVKKDMDALIDSEDSKVTVSISNYGDPDVEDYGMKYQVKSCGNEALARKYKSALDDYVQKQGGQTTLDEMEI